MSYFDDVPQHPRSEDIPLTNENEILRRQLLQGLGGVITSDFVHTYEVTDTSEEKGWFSLPNPKYLARTAFMKLDAECLGLEDIDDDLPKSSSTALFQLAVTAKGHQLDIEKSKDITPGESEELGFVWPDSFSVTLLDNTLSNISTWGFCWQPAMAPPQFDFTGSMSGFVRGQSKPENHVVNQALGIGGLGLNGPGITPGGIDRVGEFRVINEILQNGNPDLETTNKFVEVVRGNASSELLTVDPIVIQNSMPYMKKIIDASLASPSFRNMLAWQQYWEQLDNNPQS